MSRLSGSRPNSPTLGADPRGGLELSPLAGRSVLLLFVVLIKPVCGGSGGPPHDCEYVSGSFMGRIISGIRLNGDGPVFCPMLTEPHGSPKLLRPVGGPQVSAGASQVSRIDPDSDCFFRSWLALPAVSVEGLVAPPTISPNSSWGVSGDTYAVR
jgi:hypothetical protein